MSEGALRVRHVLVAEIAVGSYFACSFLYYFKPLPLGHLINVIFLLIFATLALSRVEALRVLAGAVRQVLGLVLLTGASIAAWVVRDDWDAGGLARALTWLTPAALLILLSQVEGMRHTRICAAIAAINVTVNLGVTIGFGRFNADLAKFEIAAAWAGISSNELSFHLIAFGALFLFLMESRRANAIGWALTLGSLVHLSKAHLGSMFGAFFVTVGRRRVLMMLATVVCGLVAMRWLALSEAAATLQVPPEFKRVFEPLRDLAVVGSSVLVGGGLASIGDLAGAVGLYRFEVYEAAAALLTKSPFGHSLRVVEGALGGLDPHSNILYLALREGWIVTAGYVAAILYFLSRVPTGTVRERVVFGLLVYVVLRSLFVTFDPVKLLSLALYAACVLRSFAPDALAQSPARARRAPDQIVVGRF